MKNNYDNVYGVWSVSTDADVEGRTTTFLGVFEGFVDEIALHLANKAYYSLKFDKISKIEWLDRTPTMSSVHVMFGIDSGTWGMNKETIVNDMKLLFHNRPVEIKESNYYGSFKIVAKNKEEVDKKILINKALSKLTEEEKELLNIK